MQLKLISVILLTLFFLQGCTRVESKAVANKVQVSCDNLPPNLMVSSFIVGTADDINWLGREDYIIVNTGNRTTFLPKYKCAVIEYH